MVKGLSRLHALRGPCLGNESGVSISCKWSLSTDNMLSSLRMATALFVIAKAQPVVIHLPATKAAKAHWIAASKHTFFLAMTIQGRYRLWSMVV